MSMLNLSRKAVPLSVAAILAGALWGVDVARLLGYGWMLQPFNTVLVVVAFALLCAGINYALSVGVSKKSDNAVKCIDLSLVLAIPVLFDLVLPGFSILRSVIFLLAGPVIYILLRVSQRTIGLLLSVLLPFAIYLIDISPYVGRADTFEFQVVAPTLGIAHPSGYPLYTLIGKVFSWLPFGSIAWRVNLSSAVFAALACGMVYWILSDSALQDRFKVRSLAVPVITAWVLGFSPTLWSRSIEAEVYALNAFIISVALYLALCWLREDAQLDHIIPWYGLVTGLALASHITLGAVALLAGVILLTSRPWPRMRTLIIAALLGLAGISLYLYIPLRWPAVQGGHWMSVRQFLDFVSNAGSGGALHPMAFYQDASRWGLVWRLFTQQFTAAGFVLALVGWGAWLMKQWRFAIGTLLMVLAWVWFNLGFYVADPDYSAFLIPAHVVVTVWLGFGVYTILDWLHRCQSWMLPLVLSLLLLLPATHIWKVAPALDTRSLGRQDELWARYVLDSRIKQNAAILADSEKFPPLYYLQQVEEIRSDLELVTLFNEEQYRTDMHQRLQAGQPVYMARYLPGLDSYGVSSLGPLVEVVPQISDTASTFMAVFQPSQLALLSYELQPDSYDRPMSHLYLEWYAQNSIYEDLEVHLRLRDDLTGKTVWSYTPHRPVNGYSATTAWQTEQVLNDYYALTWPEWLVGDDLSLEIALFQRFSEESQMLSDDEFWLPLDIVNIPERVLDADFEMRMVYGDGVTLVGAVVPADVFADALVTVDLRWSCALMQARDGQAILHWTSDNGQTVTQSLIPVTGKESIAWDCAGSALRRYEVTAPTTSGQHTLSVGRLDADGRSVPAQCSWLADSQSECGVADVHVGPSATGLANYQNTILLVDADFDTSEVPAGGMVHVDLDWRALQQMDLDYTVFLQVIDPDGHIYGQVDSWPVQGARPTSGWQPGEDIHDPYMFYLKDGWSAGEYEIIAGWYLLADMRRLVLYSDGLPMADYVSVGEFTLP